VESLSTTTEDVHMADLPPSPDTGPDRTSTTGTPRWVKVAGIIALAVVLLLVILLLSGGNHGPGRHTGLGDRTPSASVTADGRSP
jgi:hypothetical protein